MCKGNTCIKKGVWAALSSGCVCVLFFLVFSHRGHKLSGYSLHFHGLNFISLAPDAVKCRKTSRLRVGFFFSTLLDKGLLYYPEQNPKCFCLCFNQNMI